MKNRINNLLESKNNILSVYFTAGYPRKNDTFSIIENLESTGADLIEIGIPFSDPVADGLVIQHSNTVAIRNGMTVKLLFNQLKDIRSRVQIPLIIMSSLNPVLQFRFEKFCDKCKEVGIDGLILPDLPVEEYIASYKSVVESCGLRNIMLVTPASTDERIRLVDQHTDGFIYMVSSSATTGENLNFKTDFEFFAKRLSSMKLKNPLIAGFGIKDKATFEQVCEFSKGGIIGSAFVKTLADSENIEKTIEIFMNELE